MRALAALGAITASLVLSQSAFSALTLEINKTPGNGEVRLFAGPGETITIDGFTIYEDTLAPVWIPANLDLSGLPGLSDVGGGDPTFIATIGGATGGAPVGSTGVSIGDVFDTGVGAALTASDIYWEFSVVGGGVVSGAPVTVVPEPAAFGLFAGIASVSALRRPR